jgi:hypothetical protein
MFEFTVTVNTSGFSNVSGKQGTATSDKLEGGLLDSQTLTCPPPIPIANRRWL